MDGAVRDLEGVVCLSVVNFCVPETELRADDFREDDRGGKVGEAL